MELSSTPFFIVFESNSLKEFREMDMVNLLAYLMNEGYAFTHWFLCRVQY